MTRSGYDGIMISKEFYDKTYSIKEKLGLYHLALSIKKFYLAVDHEI